MISSILQTGPKGVIKDWQRYKQLESQKTAESEAERKELYKKLSLTCRIEPDEKETEKKIANQAVEEQFNEDEILDDPFFKDYVQQRIEEMKNRISNL